MKYALSYLILLTLLVTVSQEDLSAQLKSGDVLFTAERPVFGNLLVDDLPTNSNLFTAFASDNLTSGLLVSTGINFGVAQRNLVFGTGLSIASSFGGGVGTLLSISPFGRYYFANKPELLAYAGLRTGLTFGDNAFSSLDGVSLIPSAGLSIPVAPNVLFGPELAYAIINGPDPFILNFQVEFILGPNNRMERAESSFTEKSLMINARAGSASFGGNGIATFFSFRPGLHFFTSDNFAVGAHLAIDRFSSGNPTFDFSTTIYQLELDVRYYLITNNHWTPFLQIGGALFDFGEGRNRSDIGFDLALGGDLWLRNNLALEFGLGARVFPDFDVITYSGNIGAVFVAGRGH